MHQRIGKEEDLYKTTGTILIGIGERLNGRRGRKGGMRRGTGRGKFQSGEVLIEKGRRKSLLKEARKGEGERRKLRSQKGS